MVVLLGLALSGALLIGFMLAIAYPNLPAIDSLTDYRPKIPLRIFSADNVLIGEFGEERRNMVHIGDVPDIMKKAVLAIEDDPEESTHVREAARGIGAALGGIQVLRN